MKTNSQKLKQSITKLRLHLLGSMFMVAFALSTNAQSTTANNVFGPLKYLGYAAGVGPLNFETAGVPQMQLLGAGNLRIVAPNRGYMIAGNMFLWDNGNILNTFCGVGTGILGINDTYVGHFAGHASTGVSNFNTFVGGNAGQANNAGVWIIYRI